MLGEIGHGGMGVVYKARDRETNELVALKVLRPEIAADASAVERFKNEVRLARKIAHRNVCRIYDFSRVGSTAFISMEFIEGETLRAVLKRFGSLSVRQATSIARQICLALQEAHDQGVAHRDLKPENIMINTAGHVKLMDFGIARSLEQELTHTTGLKGTPIYMAPEQLQGLATDHRCDIYAFGLVLHEMVTGVPPAFLNKIAGLPTEITRVIVTCLEKDPLDRYQSAAEIDSALGSSSDTGLTALFNETHLVMQSGPARFLFLIIQVGYLALYCAILYYFESVQELLDTAAPAILVTSMCGVAVRIYLIFSVGLNHPEAGRKFRKLFPLLLVLDALAAASPLLLIHKMRFGLALIFCAAMAYLPFSQNTLIQNAYRK